VRFDTSAKGGSPQAGSSKRKAQDIDVKDDKSGPSAKRVKPAIRLKVTGPALQLTDPESLPSDPAPEAPSGRKGKARGAVFIKAGSVPTAQVPPVAESLDDPDYVFPAGGSFAFMAKVDACKTPFTLTAKNEVEKSAVQPASVIDQKKKIPDNVLELVKERTKGLSFGSNIALLVQLSRDPRSLELKQYLETLPGIEEFDIHHLPRVGWDSKLLPGHSNLPPMQAGRLCTSSFIDWHEYGAAVPWVPVKKGTSNKATRERQCSTRSMKI
jgi:hypothetical protein